MLIEGDVRNWAQYGVRVVPVKLVFRYVKLTGRHQGGSASEGFEAIVQDYSEKFMCRIWFFCSF